MLHIQKNRTLTSLLILLVTGLSIYGCSGSASSGSKSVGLISPNNGKLEIPVADVYDGKAHHFQVRATDGTMVTFFVLKSADGVIRAAIDACDVCYRSGLGYYQEGDNMVCKNCGQKFASNKVNVLKGGCNPAPLNRTVVGDKLVINMRDIDMNSWYMKYRQS